MLPRLFIFICALWATAASASAPDLFGYGARAIGMAGAVATAPGGAAAVYYGPAALAFETQPKVAIGFQRADLALSIDDVDYPVDAAMATTIGFVLPLGFGGALADRLVLGTGFVTPTDAILVAHLPAVHTPRFAVVSHRARTVTLQAAMGVRLNDRLALGAGVLALASLDGGIDVAPNDEGRIGSVARTQLLADYAPVLSVLAHLPGAVSASVTYRGESIARFSLPLVADLGPDFPLPLPELVVQGVVQYDPAQFDGELSIVAADVTRLAAGATWKQWSAYPQPIVYPAAPDAFPAQPSPDFEDTLELRLGAEFPIGPWTPRLGYRYIPSPTPTQRGARNDLDNVRHLFGLGVGVQWSALRVDLGFQWHHLVTRRHTKDAGRIEAAGFPLDDYPGFPAIEHGGAMWVTGIDLEITL